MYSLQIGKSTERGDIDSGVSPLSPNSVRTSTVWARGRGCRDSYCLSQNGHAVAIFILAVSSTELVLELYNMIAILSCRMDPFHLCIDLETGTHHFQR